MKKQLRLQLIFVVYWILLAYVVAALIWWFIALMNQNNQIAALKMEEKKEIHSIIAYQQRKTAQYIGEGFIFLLLIVAGAIYIYRAVTRQLKQSIQQQHFMMAITHELKTPIAVAQLNLETLKKRSLTDDQQNKLIQNTLQETARLDSLSSNMLLYSQIDAGGYQLILEKIKLDKLTEDCVAAFSNRYPERNFQASTQSAEIKGDVLMLRMVISNLLDNAVKYTPKNTTINISLRVNEKIQLCIADEGDGIADNEKKKVFEKFYRTGNEATRKAKGTGLGLFLVDRIIKKHKGYIHIENNHPKGCRFVIDLPSTA